MIEMGRVEQIGYVVRNLEDAVKSWTEHLGVGPFFCIPRYRLKSCIFRGDRSSPELKVAMAYSGAIQIELLEPLDDEPSVYREWLGFERPGIHHLTYWLEDASPALLRLESQGYQRIQDAELESGGRSVYVEHAHLPGRIELLEVSSGARAAFEYMRSAARQWDGVNPVRIVPSS